MVSVFLSDPFLFVPPVSLTCIIRVLVHYEDPPPPNIIVGFFLVFSCVLHYFIFFSNNDNLWKVVLYLAQFNPLIMKSYEDMKSFYYI